MNSPTLQPVPALPEGDASSVHEWATPPEKEDTVIEEDGLGLKDFQDELVKVDSVPFTLLDNCVKINVKGVDKYISLDTFLEILDKSIAANRQVRTEELFLPSNTYYLGRSAGKIMLTCYYAGGVRNVKYFDADRPSVVPNIIVSYLVNTTGDIWKVSSAKYFCTDLPPSRLPRRFITSESHSERIFGIPFSNHYGEGRMCYGNNVMPVSFPNGNLRGLDYYYQFLFTSPFNDDLGVRAVAGHSVSGWYSKIAKIASEGGSFPYDQLRGFTPLTA
ncbi:MAG TPA: hypothetical protein VFM18_08655 [Methanosarcina sp.]|nr:hypothetical protein [Methanosarcina sp.]